MEYLRGWRAFFGSEDWKKRLAIGSAFVFCAFIPVVNILVQIALGAYFVLALRRGVQGQDRPLPRLDFDFEYLGKLLSIGFKPFLARMIYGLAILPVVFVFILGLTIGQVLIASGEDGAQIAGAVVLILTAIFYFVAILGAQLVIGVAALRASLMEDLGQAIKPKPVLAMTRKMLGDMIVGGIVETMITIPIILLGYLCFFIGILPAAVIVMHLQVFFAAELYRRYLEKGGEPLPIGPIDVPGAQPEETRLAA